MAVVSVGSTNTTVTCVSFSHNFMISEINLFQVGRLNKSNKENKVSKNVYQKENQKRNKKKEKKEHTVSAKIKSRAQHRQQVCGEIWGVHRLTLLNLFA